MAMMADTEAVMAKEEMLTMGNWLLLNRVVWAEIQEKNQFQYCSYSVGYPHGGPHITLHTTGNLGGWGGEGAGAGAGAGGHGHGHHDG